MNDDDIKKICNGVGFYPRLERDPVGAMDALRAVRDEAAAEERGEIIQATHDAYMDVDERLGDFAAGVRFVLDVIQARMPSIECDSAQVIRLRTLKGG